MAKATMTVVPFIEDASLRSIKPNHNYTLSEVNELTLKELTELALLIPGFLEPEGWNFMYSFADGDVITKAAKPTTFRKPSNDVLEAIKQRVISEGYNMFNTVRNHFLFLEWDEFIGCFSLSSFLHNIEKGRNCYHTEMELFWTNELGFCKEVFCFEAYDSVLKTIQFDLPKHSSGYNLPVDLGHDLDDWSDEEKLTVRPFRGSWDPKEWGEFDGHPDFKPVSFNVCIGEILSFINRFDFNEGTFDSLVEAQVESFDEALSNEFVTMSIILFGYDELHEHLIRKYFPFLTIYMDVLNIIRNAWIAHTTLKGSVLHVTDGGWGHLSHAWSVSLFVGRNPATFRKNPGKYIASQRRN
jgi:hypothetical protein